MNCSAIRILTVHENYVHRGGEDESVDLEVAQLLSQGHAVDRWTVSNEQIIS